MKAQTRKLGDEAVATMQKHGLKVVDLSPGGARGLGRDSP